MTTIALHTRGRRRFIGYVRTMTAERWIVILSAFLVSAASVYYVRSGANIAYGDAESHLNIAKRVIDSLTPGFAQLGGIWLPLPHLLLVPFVYFDSLWRTGIAGAIVSGIAYIVSALYLYKLAYLLTRRKGASFFAALVFMLNPNVLYMQSTPLTELPLIVFFILSTYCFVRFLLDDSDLPMLMGAAFWGFCASLSRYDGWALVLQEAGVLFLYYLPYTPFLRPRRLVRTLKERVARWEGRLVLFSTLAFFGILLWFLWDYLILGDPLYFTHSQFSANSQQQGWLALGDLPAYHNAYLSFLYYFITSYSITGVLVMALGIGGLLLYLLSPREKHRFLIALVLLTPFFFYVATLFIGQCVIFIPALAKYTPNNQWTLFNVRYGIMMVPVCAVYAGYLFARGKGLLRTLVIACVAVQVALFSFGYAPTWTLLDGTQGLSSEIAKVPNAQYWLAQNYDGGLVLIDDYARTLSIIRTPIPMQDVIYIGTKPYWEESLAAPEKYARWIVMQKNDAVWNSIYMDPAKNARLYKYFQKVYTSDQILIFKRDPTVSS